MCRAGIEIVSRGDQLQNRALGGKSEYGVRPSTLYLNRETVNNKPFAPTIGVALPTRSPCSECSKTINLRATAIDFHVGVMASVCGTRTRVQKVSETKKVSIEEKYHCMRKMIKNDQKSVYH